MYSCCTLQPKLLRIYWIFLVFARAISAGPYVRIESVIPGIDKQPVNATLIDAVPIVAAVSRPFSGGLTDIDSESLIDASEEDFGPPLIEDIVGELMPFFPLDGCEPLRPSIFTKNVSSKVTFSPSDPNSKIVVLITMNGSCSIERKLTMAQRTPSVAGVLLIGPIPQADKDSLFHGIKSRLVVFSIESKVGEILLSLTNWYRVHRVQPIPPEGLPTLHNNSTSITDFSQQPNIDSSQHPLNSNNSTDDAWIRATLVSNQDISTNLGVLEFALLIVVVLLAVSFITSIVLHFYFFHSRGQQQGNNFATTQNAQPQVLPEQFLRYLPLRVYGDLISKEIKKTNSDDATKSTNININNSSRDFEHESSALGHMSNATFSSPAPSTHSTSSWIVSAIRNSIFYFSARKPNSLSTFNDTCPICIEDFELKTKVRELPCQHIFHPECIDAWLITRASSCPMCKFDCYAPLKQLLEEKDPEFREKHGLFARFKDTIRSGIGTVRNLFTRQHNTMSAFNSA